jgi:hypothetical protein
MVNDQDSILQEAASQGETKRTNKGFQSVGNEENTLDTTTGGMSGMSPGRQYIDG